MTTDSAGNAYVAGWTMNDALPITPGVVQPKFGGGLCLLSPSIPSNFTTCPDAFVIKFDAQGNVAFATYLGGSGWDQASSIGVDAAGNIYIAGSTSSPDFPKSASARFVGPGLVFLAKLNSTGTALLYTALFPGTGVVPAQTPGGLSSAASSNVAMTVDQAGNAYFTCRGTPGFPVSQKPLQASGPLAVGKLDPTGTTLLYGTYLGGSGSQFVSGIALDSNGNAYITGSTNSTDFPVTPGALQTTLQSANNSFVAKLNATGDHLIYSTYLGATSIAYATQIRVDASGNAYVLGSVQSAGFPVTADAFESNYADNSGFLSKLSVDGTAFVYSTFLSIPPSALYLATNASPPGALDVDADGNAYVAGAMGPGFPVSSDALQPCYGGGGDDVFVAEFSPNGMLATATYLGGSDIENAYATTVAGDGTEILVGDTSSADFPITQDSPLKAPGYFLSRFRIADPANAASPCLTLALQNSATLQEGPIAPGELVTLRGLRFGPEIGVGAQLDSSGNIAIETANVRVLFDEIAAPLLYVQSEQINAQAPWELAGRSTSDVHVEYNGLFTKIAHAAVAPYAPAFFQSDATGHGAILNQDGTLNSESNPAKIGSVVAIFGTGAGPTAPAGITGGIAQLAPLALLTSPVSVQVNGTDAEILYAGSAPTLISGVFQINFRVPATLPIVGAYFVSIRVGNQAGDEWVIISIESTAP